jgi:hypothetical protein
MKLIYILALCLSFIHCKKHTENKPLDYTLTYEVITSSGTWFGEYKDSTGQQIQTGLAMPSGWKYTFKLKNLPCEMFVNATVSCICSGSPTSPDVTINFYSNGDLFKTETNTWAKGVASLGFEIK